MMDSHFEKIAYNYFNDGPIVETETGTYADKQAPIELQSVGWNHGISEVISSLIGQGLTIDAMQEFDYSPYNCFVGMTEVAPKKWRIQQHGNKLPLVYTIKATKP
jgi:hypothetical protein